MALSADLSARVARLLPLLGSDQTGEVAATAAALTRVLGTAGRDLHDLAEHVAEGPREVIVYRERPAPHPGPRDCGDWRRAFRDLDPRRRHRAQVVKVRAAPSGFLSPWEVEFCASLARQLEGNRTLSAKQSSILADIHARFEDQFG